MTTMLETRPRTYDDLGYGAAALGLDEGTTSGVHFVTRSEIVEALLAGGRVNLTEWYYLSPISNVVGWGSRNLRLMQSQGELDRALADRGLMVEWLGHDAARLVALDAFRALDDEDTYARDGWAA